MIQTCSSTENSRTNDSSAFNSFQLFAFLCLSSFELESSWNWFSRLSRPSPPLFWTAVISFSRDFNLRHLCYRYIAELFPDSLKTFFLLLSLMSCVILCSTQSSSLLRFTSASWNFSTAFFFLCSATKCNLIHHWMRQRNFTCWLSGKWDEGNCGVIKIEVSPQHQQQKKRREEKSN